MQTQNDANLHIHKSNEINSNWKYRQYLQSNANQIMKMDSLQYINQSGINPYTMKNNQPINTSPLSFSSIYDTNTPFRNSDLKQSFMKKEQQQGSKIAPSIPAYYINKK